MAPIKAYLENNQNPVIVINTHYHWDHISCISGHNAIFGKEVFETIEKSIML